MSETGDIEPRQVGGEPTPNQIAQVAIQFLGSESLRLVTEVQGEGDLTKGEKLRRNLEYASSLASNEAVAAYLSSRPNAFVLLADFKDGTMRPTFGPKGLSSIVVTSNGLAERITNISQGPPYESDKAIDLSKAERMFDIVRPKNVAFDKVSNMDKAAVVDRFKQAIT